MHTLTYLHVHRMLIGAYMRIVAGRDEINKINVFPVPDQDTGSNMVRTLRGIYDMLHDKHYGSMRDLTHDALEGALTASAGNAGIITTSFLGGLLESFTHETVDTAMFIKAFRHGSDIAYQSVQEPKRGTILDVMRDTASHLAQVQPQTPLIEVFDTMVASAHEALQQTTTHMPAYRKAKVVDAGGLGFVYLLEGFRHGLTHETIEYHDIPDQKDLHHKPLMEIVSKRFEVISIITHPVHDQSTVMIRLNPHGDCIDIVRVHDKMKIHIHTDEPNTVYDLLQEFGDISHVNTVDMNEGEHQKSVGSIGIITDEGASLPLQYSVNHDIAIVPFQLEWEETQSIPELESLTLYEKMRHVRKTSGVHTPPKTSQPSIYSFLKAFKDHLQKYDHVVCLTTSSKVSGTYNSALQARNQLSQAHKERVHVPDLMQALPGHALLVQRAIELSGKKFSLPELLRDLHLTAKKTHVFGFGSDAYWLTKGGRLSPRKAKALTIALRMGIQPVVGVTNGRLGVCGFIKRRKSLAEMAFRYIKDTYRDGKKYDVIVHHADNPTELKQLTKYLEGTSFSLVQDSLLSPVAGIHIGPDALIVGVQSNHSLADSRI